MGTCVITMTTAAIPVDDRSKTLATILNMPSAYFTKIWKVRLTVHERKDGLACGHANVIKYSEIE